MKKVLAITTLVVLCLTFGLAQAGPSCSKKTDESSTSATNTNNTGEATAKLASSGSACGAHASLAAAYCTPEECEEMKAKYGDKMEMRTMSIKGMTCGSCESKVTTALKDVDGVLKVMMVSQKDEMAIVCVDKTVAKSDMLTQAVANTGFEAEIITAVAMTSTGATDSKAGCSADGKASGEKKGCCASKGKASKASADPQ